MNSNTELRRPDGYAPDKWLAISNMTGHALVGYLMSIADVVLALGIMISISGISLLTLYSAVGAL